jgi:hypothetical protein
MFQILLCESWKCLYRSPDCCWPEVKALFVDGQGTTQRHACMLMYDGSEVCQGSRGRISSWSGGPLLRKHTAHACTHAGIAPSSGRFSSQFFPVRHNSQKARLSKNKFKLFVATWRRAVWIRRVSGDGPRPSAGFASSGPKWEIILAALMRAKGEKKSPTPRPGIEPWPLKWHKIRWESAAVSFCGSGRTPVHGCLDSCWHTRGVGSPQSGGRGIGYCLGRLRKNTKCLRLGARRITN